MPIPPVNATRRARAFASLAAVALASCELAPQRTGVCLGPMPLVMETFTRAESFHDDCRGPDGSGDIFTLSVAAQSNVLLQISPEGSFAPTMQVYAGEYLSENPLLVAELSTQSGGTLGVRTVLAPGEYFVVAGTSTRTRATYRMSAEAFTGIDCNYWNFTTPGVELSGEVTAADCPVIFEVRSESFEMWRAAGDSINVTIVADSAGSFSFGEACCEFTTIFSQVLGAGDSITFGHRAPRRRPYRASFQRDVGELGPGSYRLHFH